MSANNSVQVDLPNNKTLVVPIPSGANPVCEVKRAVSKSLNLSPLLQRVSVEGSVDKLEIPTKVRVALRAARQETQTVQVRTLSEQRVKGESLFEVKVDPSDSVLDLKFLLSGLLKVAPDHQRLYFRPARSTARIHLNDSQALSAAGVFAQGVKYLQVMFEFPSGIEGHGNIHASRPTILARRDEKIKTMGDVFLAAAKNQPKGKFLGTRAYLTPGKPDRGEYKWISYGEAAVRVGNLGAGMRALGFQNNETIGIVSQNRAEWTLTDMMCNVESFISVPLYDTLGPDAVEYIINHSQIRAVVASVKEVKAIHSIRSKCPTLQLLIVMDDTVNDQHLLQSIPREMYQYRLSEVEKLGSQNLDKFPAGIVKTTPESIHTICYTSGTTGNPKGAILTHGNLVSAMYAIDERAPPEEKSDDEISFSYLPLAHIYERILQANMVLNAGGIGFSQGDPLKLLEDVGALRPTIFPGVPRVWQRIYDRVHSQAGEAGLIKSSLFTRAMNAKLHKLHTGDVQEDGVVTSFWDKIVFEKIAALFGGRVKLMATGAAPLPVKVGEFMRVTFNAKFVEGYGMTETAAGLTCGGRDDCNYGQVGTALSCNLIKLVDVPDMEYRSTDKPCPRGEIWVHGANIFAGYYKQEDVTAEVFETDPQGRKWMKTGDIGMWLPDGSLKIIDRKKNILKLSQGEYVAPEKIEGIYKQTKQLANIYVHGDSLENYLIAVVYPDVDQLKAFAATNGIKGATVKELVASPKVERWLYDLMEATGKREKLRGFEMVKRIYVSSEDFTVENNLLTPTFKLKRNIAAKHFADQIKRMYQEGEKAMEKIQAKL